MKPPGLNVYPQAQRPIDDECSNDGFVNIVYSFNGMLKLQALSRHSSYFTNIDHFYGHHVGSVVFGWIPASNTAGYAVWLNKQIDTMRTIPLSTTPPPEQKIEKRKIRLDEI